MDSLTAQPLYPEGRSPGTHCIIRDGVENRAGLDISEKGTISCPCCRGCEDCGWITVHLLHSGFNYIWIHEI